MDIVDITGPIYTGMWNYSEPIGSLLGNFRLSNFNFEYGGEKYSLEAFEGFKAQTGTYLESPGKYQENKSAVSDIDLEKLFMIDSAFLYVPHDSLNEKDGKKFISLDNLKNAEKETLIPGEALLVGTGYGTTNWENKDFFSGSWFFKKEAMEYIISKKPFLLATDSAEWENPKHPEGIFNIFYPADILILASCINFEKIKKYKVKLTVLPFKVLGSFLSPVRAIVTF